jgi:uncharacterized membrane protein YgcG
VNRSRIALAFLVLLVGFLAVRWFLAEPSITADFVETPLHQVIRTMERQGRVTLRSNLDPDTPVTLRLHRAPVVEAIDLLAVRLDADWRWSLVVGPDRATVAEGLALATEGRRQTLSENGWQTYFYPTPWQSIAVEPPDPRRFSWRVEPPETPALAAYLDQASQKLPVQIFAPADWEPAPGRPPRSGSLAQTISALLRPSRGHSAEVFLVQGFRRGGGEGRPTGGGETAARGESAAGQPRGDGSWGGGAGGGRWTGGNNPNANQRWLDERNEQLIAALPPEEQVGVRESENLFREFRESTRDLSAEDRGAVATEFFNRPEVQQRMEEAMANRDAKRTPEQREARYRRLVDRKLQQREEDGRPLIAQP